MYTVKMRTGLSIMCGLVSVIALITLGYEICREQVAMEAGIMMIYLTFYAIRKRVVVNVEGFVYYPAIGKKKTVTWSEIDMVKTAPAKYGKDITIYDRENHRICKLEASMKNQADFIETMRMHYVPIW